jgi:hypothetical protein
MLAVHVLSFWLGDSQVSDAGVQRLREAILGNLIAWRGAFARSKPENWSREVGRQYRSTFPASNHSRVFSMQTQIGRSPRSRAIVAAFVAVSTVAADLWLVRAGNALYEGWRIAPPVTRSG